MVKNKKGELDQKDFELILLNVTRLFPNSPELTPEIISYIRTSLPELRGSTIMMLGRCINEFGKKLIVSFFKISRETLAFCRVSLFLYPVLPKVRT